MNFFFDATSEYHSAIAFTIGINSMSVFLPIIELYFIVLFCLHFKCLFVCGLRHVSPYYMIDCKIFRALSGPLYLELKEVWTFFAIIISPSCFFNLSVTSVQLVSTVSDFKWPSIWISRAQSLMRFGPWDWSILPSKNLSCII